MLLLLNNFFGGVMYPQNQQQEPEKKQATIQLSFFKNADQGRFVIANVSTKNDSGKLVFVNSAKVDFYFKQPAGESFVASAFTNEGGKASVSIPDNLPADTSGLTFVVWLRSNQTYADAEAESAIKDARVVLNLSEKDTARLITATVSEVQMNNKEKPAANVEVSFGVKRLFGIMPLSDEAIVTTNDEGVATFYLPKEIKGDEKGNIVLVARINDSEQYGTVEATTSARWGVPLVADKNPFPRALWEPRAPVLLIVVFSIIFGGIWLTYGTVVYQIYRIEKIKPTVKTQ